MKALGIDHGDKRIGIAVSDELGMLAHPLEYILAEPYEIFLKRLKNCILLVFLKSYPLKAMLEAGQ